MRLIRNWLIVAAVCATLIGIFEGSGYFAIVAGLLWHFSYIAHKHVRRIAETAESDLEARTGRRTDSPSQPPPIQ